MPLLKNAKKKLRQDKKRALRNRKLKVSMKKLVKTAKAQKKPETINSAFASIDKAAKNKIIHKNKAARLKSSLSKAIAKSSKSA